VESAYFDVDFSKVAGMLKATFQALVGKAAAIDSRNTGENFLQLVRRQYGFAHVAYLGVNIPSQKPPGFYFHNTYSDAWRLHYHSRNFILIDPVVRQGLLGLVPQDWDALRKSHPGGKCVFDESLDFGIRQRGLSFPVRGVHGETAVFSVTADVSRREWQHITKLCMPDLQTLAAFFHQGVLKQSGIDIGDDGKGLSNPERECLKWTAEGKSAWETSKIMRISESTVKFHLSNARYKLHCVTTTQAVAKAISLRVIVWP
jgi:DNA-binding CsgD family transcriptional regulator